jgi:hypothetical protein
MKSQEVQALSYFLFPLQTYLERNSINEHNIDWIKNYLQRGTFLSILNYKQKIPKFQRVTVNPRILKENIRINDLNYLANPPEKCVKRYGRANNIGESVFYATFDPLTALSEMRPNIGDLITISNWKLKNDYKLRIAPIFKNNSIDGIIYNETLLNIIEKYQKEITQHEISLREQIEIIIQFISDCFSKEVDDSNHYDYFLSAYYSKRIFCELQGGNIEAILYPSVRQSLTLNNIVIKPSVLNKNYEIESIEENRVIQIPSGKNNGWILEGTGDSKTFENNKIIWK